MNLGACPTLTFLLRRTIRDHLRRSRPEKILNVFQRIHLRFFRACGLASGRTSFASSRTAMSDRLLVDAIVGEQRPVVFGSIVQLRCIGTAEIVSVPGGEHLEAVRTQQLDHQHRDIFMKVQPDEERGVAHRRQGWI